MAKAVYYTLFDEDMGPTNKFFDFIKSSWDNIDTALPINVLDGDPYKEEALSFYREVLTRRNRRNDLTIRDD